MSERLIFTLLVALMLLHNRGVVFAQAQSGNSLNNQIVFASPCATYVPSSVPVNGAVCHDTGTGQTYYWVNGSGFVITPGGDLTNSVINVKSYGAKGDGVTDDAAALIAAWRALPQINGVLLLPKGTYLVKSTVTWDNGGVAGQRQEVTVLGYGGIIKADVGTNFTGKAVVQILGVADARMEGLHVQANGTSNANDPAVGLAVTPSADAGNPQANLIGQVYIDGYFTTANLYLISAENSDVRDSTFVNYGPNYTYYDSSSDKAGLSISPAQGKSNTRKMFTGCNFLGYYAGSQNLIFLQGAEWVFDKNYSFVTAGHIFDESGSSQANDILVRSWRTEWGQTTNAANRFWYDNNGVTGHSHFLDIYSALNAATAAVFEFTSGNPGDMVFDRIFTDNGAGDAIKFTGVAMGPNAIIATRLGTIKVDMVDAGTTLASSYIASNANADPLTGAGAIAANLSGTTVVGSSGQTVYAPSVTMNAPNFQVTGLTTTGSATGKKVVCVDTANGRLYASSATNSCAN